MQSVPFGAKSDAGFNLSLLDNFFEHLLFSPVQTNLRWETIDHVDHDHLALNGFDQWTGHAPIDLKVCTLDTICRMNRVHMRHCQLRTSQKRIV